MFYSRIEVGVEAGAGQQIFAQLQLLYLKKKNTAPAPSKNPATSPAEPVA